MIPIFQHLNYSSHGLDPRRGIKILCETFFVRPTSSDFWLRKYGCLIIPTKLAFKLTSPARGRTDQGERGMCKEKNK